MKFRNNFTNKQSISDRTRWLSPMIAISILGLTSGSFGYYIAVKKTFFQDSKADAIKVAAVPQSSDPNYLQNASLNLKGQPVNKVYNTRAAIAQLQAARSQGTTQGLSAIRSIPIKFQAVPITGDLIAYRVPGRQALEDPSSIGKPLKLQKDRFYNVVEVVTVDNHYWLKLDSSPDQPVYIDPNRVLCTTPNVCIGEWKNLELYPLSYNFYASRVNQIPEQLSVGW